MTNDNERIVRDFIAAWSSLDVERLLGFFAEDGVYHNMPIAPVAGHASLRGFIGAFLKDWTRTEWEILHLVSAGEVVIAERIDRTWIGEKAVVLPCCGVFEMEAGKIKVWRDYFDMTTFIKAATG
ncbi:MAG: nuclear transport factor 2 family protein [Alphaproteobacteria bacterium]|nr:nuclear transport factor 2 family protein [Alphaproteobacteria bacterium]